MNDVHVALVVGVPALALLSLAAGRAVFSQVRLPVSSPGSKIGHDSFFDWALHFAVGSMLLGILTIGGLAAVDRPHPVVGLFTGVVAAVGAYVLARPPIRQQARNPELDGPLFAVSVAAHAAVGVAVALLLISTKT